MRVLSGTQALSAIIGDTWRQSVQQKVFFLLYFAMAVAAFVFLFLPKVFENGTGQKFLGVRVQDNPQMGLEAAWDLSFRQVVEKKHKLEEKLAPLQKEATAAQEALRQETRKSAALRREGASEEEVRQTRVAIDRAVQKVKEAQTKVSRMRNNMWKNADSLVSARRQKLSLLEKGVGFWLSKAASWLFSIGMLGFIAACAGYFPNTLAAGAVDILVSKPIRRYQIFFGKYLGGLVLFSIALVLTYLIIFVGMGIRTGIWHTSFFLGIPMTLFAVALLYAIVAWFGVFTRSTALAMVVGYIFYLAVDSMLGLIQMIAQSPLAKVESLMTVSEVTQWLFPGFGRLEDSVESSVLALPYFEWQPIGVALIWMVILLGTALRRFQRMDF